MNISKINTWWYKAEGVRYDKGYPVIHVKLTLLGFAFVYFGRGCEFVKTRFQKIRGLWPRLGGQVALPLFDDRDPPGSIVPWDVYEKMTVKKRPEEFRK